MSSVCIHQPDFLPFLGFYQKLKKSDQYVVLDHVQFIKRGWHNRDQIKTPGGAMWLTVPVQSKGNYQQSLKETRIDNSQDWQRKHLNALRANYSKAPFWKDFFSDIEAIYQKGHDWLVEFNLELIHYFLDKFNIRIPMHLSSEMEPQGKKDELLIDLCKKCEATVYVTGTGSDDYLREPLFQQQGLEVIKCQLVPREYPQLFGEFVPYLSAVDFLFNCGTNTEGYIE